MKRIILSHLHDEQEKWEEYRKSACQFFAATEEVDGAFVRIFGSMEQITNSRHVTYAFLNSVLRCYATNHVPNLVTMRIFSLKMA